MTKEAKAGQASNLAERENEDGRKMVWQECAERAAKLEWGIKVKSKRGCREKQQRGFEELRQLNHEDRRASAEMFGKKSGREELEDTQSERRKQKSLKSMEKVRYYIQLGSHHRLKSWHSERKESLTEQ